MMIQFFSDKKNGIYILRDGNISPMCSDHTYAWNINVGQIVNVKSLISCSPEIGHRLSKRVNLDLYADKLTQKAITLILVEDGAVKAFGSVYVNNLIERVAYLSLISCAEKCTNKGYGGVLFQALLSYAEQIGMNVFRLEVEFDNYKAINFYYKNHMKIHSLSDYGYIMEKELTHDNQVVPSLNNYTWQRK